MTRSQLAAAAAIITLANTWGCRSPQPANLFQASERLVEGSAAGADLASVRYAGKLGMRIDDVLQRGFAAGPPSVLRFQVDVPRHGRLHLVCGISPRYHERPGVEFVAKLRHDGREDVVWSLLVDPIARPEHRTWVSAAVDLSRYAGRGRELLLETRGYEGGDDSLRAFWGTPAITGPQRRAPLAIVYLVDTLRADHTSVYGYERETTPELKAFARDAVVFDQAVVHASWTKPSVASILTGQPPARHGAVQLRDALSPEIPTLASRFAERGWSTGAAIANSVIYAGEAHFDPGFERFVGLHGYDEKRSKLVGADVVVDAALDFVRARLGLPTFLYVHTMDPHVPYTPWPPFDRMFEPFPTPDHPAQDPRTDYKEPLDRERMIAQYDGEIAQGDREFGRFLRELRKAGVYDQALIVFLADHGEEFLDHGLWLHGRSLFDELIRVPLLVKFPGNRWAGQRVTTQVQGLDLVPTLLHENSLPLPSELAGVPLQRTVEGGPKTRPALSEISHRGIVAHGVRTEKDKFIRRFSPNDDQLYFDLAKDPREATNRAGEASQRVRFLEAQAEKGMVANPFRYVVQIAGKDAVSLHLETAGWLEAVETTGFGPQERTASGGNGRWLDAFAQPRAGFPREISFTVRPIGVPVLLSGTRAGRALRKGDVAIGRTGFTPDAFPSRLPDVESETEANRGLKLFEPPAEVTTGVRVWLALPPGRKLEDMDPATRETMKALGYIGVQ